MELILKSILINIGLIFSLTVNAQYIGFEIKSILNVKDKKEIGRAEEYIKQGDLLLQEAYSLENKNNLSFKDVSDYEPDKIRSLDYKSLEVLRSATRRKIMASNQYGTANVIIIAILNKNLKKYTNILNKEELEVLERLSKQSEKLLIKGRTIRGKSMQIRNELLVYPKLIEANAIEQKAISKLLDAYALVIASGAVKNRMKPENSEIENIGTNTKLYYQIQIAASKTPLSVKKIEKLYPNLTTVSSRFENGWYKYSIRKKFKTYAEASAYKTYINVNGTFIVAYLNNKKVTIKEALAAEKN